MAAEKQGTGGQSKWMYPKLYFIGDSNTQVVLIFVSFISFFCLEDAHVHIFLTLFLTLLASVLLINNEK